jgi:hypothetical protein
MGQVPSRAPLENQKNTPRSIYQQQHATEGPDPDTHAFVAFLFTSPQPGARVVCWRGDSSTQMDIVFDEKVGTHFQLLRIFIKRSDVVMGGP